MLNFFFQLVLIGKYLDSIVTMFVDFIMQGRILPSKILVWLSNTYEIMFNNLRNSPRSEDCEWEYLGNSFVSLQVVFTW